MYAEESPLAVSLLLSSRNTMIINEVAAKAVEIASKGEYRRERVIAAMFDSAAAAAAAAAAANSMPQAGAIASMETRLLLALRVG